MAFCFNWSPLIADSAKARLMLTAALNKSPKPPIIVDKITVTELNLGSVAPELEILEIGDLAQDRFRGIFRLAYAGDAFLTLQTRVQANPLKTHLSTSPAFTAPRTLAADAGLTIPLQITLSDFKLAGFVILVFSRQKGLTIVFRNDPLESLKVSSTFDSIPFVRDYLQRVIESQLRKLFVDDLPAIIHRLSLRWSPDYREEADPDPTALAAGQTSCGTGSSSSPGADWVDDKPDLSDVVHQFSQKNMLHMAFLQEVNNTLSLNTPTIPGTAFRASMCQYRVGAIAPYFSHLGFSRAQSTASLPSVRHMSADHSSFTSSSSLLSSSSRTRKREKRRRVVDLRKKAPVQDIPQSEATTTTAGSATVPGPADLAGSSERVASMPAPPPPAAAFQYPAHVIADPAPLAPLVQGPFDSLTYVDEPLPSGPPPSYTEHPGLMESSLMSPVGKDGPAARSPAKPAGHPVAASGQTSPFRPALGQMQSAFFRPALPFAGMNGMLRQARPPLFHHQPGLLRPGR